MKYLYHSVLILLCLHLRSQTLTQTFNEPKPGDRHTTLNLDTTAFLNGLPVQTGSNVVWDFSQLQADSFAFTTRYESPSASSYSANFPNATVVQIEGAFLNAFLRSATTPSALTEVLGIHGTSISTTFTNPAIAAVYPIAMGYSHTDNFAGTFTMSGISGNCTGNLKSTAEGTGTVVLPDGITYNNVLRLKTSQTMTGTQGLFSATIKLTNIEYYDTSEKFPVLTISYTSISTILGTTVTAGASGNARSFLVSLDENELNAAEIVCFPNPAKDRVTVQLPSFVTGALLRLRDQAGREIRVQEIRSPQETLDVRDLSPGIYVLQVDKEADSVRRKLVIE